MMVTGSFSKLLAPGIFEIFDNRYNEVPLIGEQFFNRENSNRKTLDTYGFTGFGNPEVVREAEEYPMSDAKPTPGKTVEATKYGLGYEITEELLKFDLYGVVRQLPEMLADAMRYYRELLAVDVFVRGATTARTTPDGQPLFSASHVLERTGAVVSNIITPAALSATSLQTALQVYRTQKNANGRTMSARPKFLVVGSANEFIARQILGTAQVLGSNNNDVNIVAQEGLQLIVWPALDESTVTRNAWFLLPENGAHKLFLFENMPLDHQMWDEAKRDVSVHRARYMLTFDFWDWRNLVASYAT